MKSIVIKTLILVQMPGTTASGINLKFLTYGDWNNFINIYVPKAQIEAKKYFEHNILGTNFFLMNLNHGNGMPKERLSNLDYGYK